MKSMSMIKSVQINSKFSIMFTCVTMVTKPRLSLVVMGESPEPDITI